MGSNKLTVLLFLVATGAGAVIGAISTAGWRSRTLWAIALLFGVLSLAYLRAVSAHETMLGIGTIWGMSPLISVLLGLLVVGGRRPIEPAPRIGPARENPALSAQYLNELIAGITELEAKNRIKALGPQRARMKGEVVDAREGWNGRPRVKVAGLVSTYGSWTLDSSPQSFRKNQAAALAAIKPGDWIEFVGTVIPDSQWGWVLSDCEFVGRVEKPARAVPNPARRRKASEETEA